MGYEFVILPNAEKQLKTLEKAIARRILKKLMWIAAQEHPLRHAVRLHDAKIGDARFRVGDYRIVAIIDEKKRRVNIAEIGHRREIYRF